MQCAVCAAVCCSAWQCHTMLQCSAARCTVLQLQRTVLQHQRTVLQHPMQGQTTKYQKKLLCAIVHLSLTHTVCVSHTHTHGPADDICIICNTEQLQRGQFVYYNSNIHIIYLCVSHVIWTYINQNICIRWTSINKNICIIFYMCIHIACNILVLYQNRGQFVLHNM